jgi:hypothetical protein
MVMSIWKYIRRTLKGILLLAMAIIIFLIVGLGIAWLYDIALSIFGGNFLKIILAIPLLLWGIGFLLFAAYQSGKDWENR